MPGNTYGSMAVNASELRTPLQVQAWVGHPDGSGGQDGEWTDAFMLYCKVEWNKGTEQYKALRLQSTTWAKITARWDRRLTPKHRVILPPPIPEGLDQGILNVRGVWNIEMRNHFMEFIAEAGVGS